MPVYAEGRWTRVQRYRGHCNDPQDASGFTESATWRAAQNALTAQKGDMEKLDSAFAQTWLDQYARKMAIETAEMEHRVFIKTTSKDRLATEGFETLLDSDQKENGKELPKKVAIKRLKAEERSVWQMIGDARSGRPLDNEMIRKWRKTIMDKRLGGGGYRLALPVVIYDEINKDALGCPSGVRARWGMRKFPELAEKLIKDETTSTAYAAARLHGEVGCLHPWSDGNGRTSRLIVAFTFLRRGKQPPVIYADDRKGYFNALRAGRHWKNKETKKIKKGSWVALAENIETHAVRTIGEMTKNTRTVKKRAQEQNTIDMNVIMAVYDAQKAKTRRELLQKAKKGLGVRPDMTKQQTNEVGD